MKERPIIFRAEMVLAILAGRKTQTRRIVKPCHMATVDAEQFPILAMYPCGSPGDRLWVRGTCRAEAIDDEGLCADLAESDEIREIKEREKKEVVLEVDLDKFTALSTAAKFGL